MFGSGDESYLMFRVESVELSVTQMCIYCFVILDVMLDDLSCIIVLVMLVLKGSSYLYLQESVYVLLVYCICCNFVERYTVK